MSGSLLYFNGLDANGKLGLWVSDGTAGGTREITGINGASANGIDPEGMTVFGGKVLFNGVDAAGNSGLWVTDGTAGGTYELTGIANASPGGLDPSDMTVFGNEVLFFGTDATGATGLWETNGTAAGTLEIATGVSGSDMTVYNGEVLFAGSNGGLWKTDGTAAGTSQIVGGLIPYSLTVFDGVVLFGSYSYQNLWLTTGTAAGTLEVETGTFVGGEQYISPTQGFGEAILKEGSIYVFNGIADFQGDITTLVTDYGGSLVGVDGATVAAVLGGSGPVSLGSVSPVSFPQQMPVDLTAFPTNIVTPSGVVGFGSVLVYNGFSSYNGYGQPGEGNGLWLAAPQTNETYDVTDSITGAYQTAWGLNPTDITVFNGALYFNGYDTAGDPVLFEFGGNWALNAMPGQQPALLMGGFELTGISGASSRLDPSDLTTVTALPITVAQLLADEAATPSNLAPSGYVYVVTDTAADIETLTPAEITAGKAIGLGAITATDASVVLSVAQAEALEDPVAVSVPAGDTVSVADTAADIMAMTPTEAGLLSQIGVSEITATDASVTLTVAQFLAILDPIAVQVPPGDSVTIADTAANIETLTPAQIAAIPAAGVSAIIATDTSVTLSIAQAAALAAISLHLTVPAGDTATVFDTAADIEALTAEQAAALSAYGATTIALLLSYAANPSAHLPPAGEAYVVADTVADIQALTTDQIASLLALGAGAIVGDGSVAFTVAQALALEDPLVVAVPEGDSVSVTDTAAAIEAMTPAQIAALPQTGVTVITATDASVVFTVAQALALEAGPLMVAVPAGDSVGIGDTAAAIETLTAAEIAALPASGITAIAATDASVVLSIAQAVALDAISLNVTVPAGDTVTVTDTIANVLSLSAEQIAAIALPVTVADTAADIEALTTGQVAALAADGVTAIAATNASVPFTAAEALTLANASLHVTVPHGDTVSIADSAAHIEALTPAQIAALGTVGVSAITPAGGVAFTVAQAVALETASITVSSGYPAVADTAASIEALTPAQITALPAAGIATITATDTSLAFTVGQAAALVSTPLSVSVPSGDTVTIADTAAQIEALSLPTIAALLNTTVTGITATDASVALTVAQAEALDGVVWVGGSMYQYPPLRVTVPPGDSVSIADTAANIEAMTPLQITQVIDDLGVSAIAATDTSIVLTIAQAQRTAGSAHVSAPAGHSVSIADTAANIGTLLESGSGAISTIAYFDNASTFAATDGSVTLTAAEAASAENTMFGTSVTIAAPPGDSVTLADTAANIEAMTAAGLSGLASIGVTEVTVTDRSLTLTVAQALALSDPIPIVVPPGDSVIVADTEAAIESLTPAEIAGLAALGVGTIEVSSLTGAAPLTIDAGVTLAVSGRVPANQMIDFVGSGGTLKIGDTPDMAGTVFGFSPPDTIDLADIAYDPTSSAQLDPANPADDGLQVVANGNTYSLQLDPSRVFPTATTFDTGEDAGGGTDITVTEAPVTTYTVVGPGHTADGLVIAAGGELEATEYATANRTTIASGGVLLADNNAFVADAVIQSGGLLDLNAASDGFGAIGFGTPGGTLEIDDGSTLNGTIVGFAPGDTIDLTAIPFDPDGTATPGPGNELNVIENGSTYTLPFDPTQYFLNDGFTLTADANGMTDIGLVQAPVTSGVTVPSGMVVDGALVVTGGSVDVQAAAALNNGTVGQGGTVSVEAGGTARNAVIDNEGLLALRQGSVTGNAISFGSGGGMLAIDGTILPTATVYGFGGPDSIDLAGIPFDASGTATPEAGNALQIVENSDTYTLQLDPSQVFLSSYSFNLGADAGDGTYLNLVQAPVDFSASLSSGQTAAGIDVVAGGQVFVGSGGMLDAGIVDNGGYIYVGTGGAIANAVIDNGGLLELGTQTEAEDTIEFGAAGGDLQIDDTVMPSATIDGFAAGDTIDLAGVPYDPSGTTALGPGNELQIIENSGTYNLQLGPAQDFSKDTFVISADASAGTDVNLTAALCFCAGALIATPSGATAVEHLTVGDPVLTHSGEARPIVWIGKGRVLATRGHRSAATPVIIRKGALADNVPHHDLRVTKGHSLFMDGVLIPVEFLVNHRSIIWDDRAQEVNLYHIELATHDVLIANGAPAESYRDDGNRWLFHNANSGWDQPPKEPCAPVLTGGPIVDAAWRRLLERAGPRPGIPTTDDPDLHLVVDGRRLDAAAYPGAARMFRLPAERASVRIVSRAGVPDELGVARDPRKLGIAVRQIAVQKGRRLRIVEAADARLTDGFHAFEADCGLRWTDGDAALPTALLDGFDGPMELVLHLGGATTYPLYRDVAAAA